VFGYDSFYIADGSVVPVNLSVNPSLTICALAEWIADHVPPNSAASPSEQRGAACQP
jgi:cholesterol oxidase